MNIKKIVAITFASTAFALAQQPAAPAPAAQPTAPAPVAQPAAEPAPAPVAEAAPAPEAAPVQQAAPVPEAAAEPAPAPAAPAPAAPAPAAPAPGSIPAAKSGTSDRGISQSRKAILDDEKLNSMLKAFPGSSVVGIRDGN